MEKPTLMADPNNSGWNGDCPKIWKTADGRYWLQGRMPPPELRVVVNLAPGDDLVELDPQLIGWTPPSEAV